MIQSGLTSATDAEQSGCPSILMTEGNIADVPTIILD